MGGRGREGGSRAKPDNQLVYNIYIYIYIYIYICVPFSIMETDGILSAGTILIAYF